MSQRPPVGFILLTHQPPTHSVRLLRTLAREFGTPPVEWHHDFDKADLGPVELPGVNVVRPHVPTKRAGVGLVLAVLEAMRRMMGRADAPEWVVLLSGACYPVRPGAQVIDELLTSGVDAFIRHEAIRPDAVTREWHRECLRRYCTKRVARLPRPLASLRRRKLVYRDVHAAWPGPLARAFFPFSSKLACHAGEFWFSASARACRHILDFTRTEPLLLDHYRTVHCPDESYFQCVLANAPGLKLANEHRRHIVWEPGAWSPKTLTIGDLDAIRASGAQFGRKFDATQSAELLDAIDATILSKGATSST